MVINHEFQYLFIEIPQTASSATRRELRTHYGAQPLLHKHSSYTEFLNIANSEERNYFTFACIRNPLDIVVSKYFKALTLRGQKLESVTPMYFGLSRRGRAEFAFAQTEDPSFAKYLHAFYKFVYNSRACLLPDDLGCLMRYENLQHDFRSVVARLGLPVVRDLPVRNPTTLREGSFEDYYTPDVRDHAQKVFGPFMQRWGFQFPQDWGEVKVPKASLAVFQADSALRRFYHNKIESPALDKIKGRRKRPASAAT